MNQAEKLTGQTMIHPDLGNVEVMEAKSRVKVMVKVLGRGPGWNEQKQKYTGVRIKTGWYRGENREFGTIHETHIDKLN